MTTIPGRFLVVLFGLAVMTGCARSGEQPPAAQSGAAQEAGQPAAPPATESTPSPRPASTPMTVSPDFRPEAAGGAVPGVPATTNTAPIVAVANYFTELPGMDIAALNPRQREHFLQQVNSEMCPCGCKNDTLARCYVNDPRCPTVKGMVQRVYDEVKAGK